VSNKKTLYTNFRAEKACGSTPIRYELILSYLDFKITVLILWKRAEKISDCFRNLLITAFIPEWRILFAEACEIILESLAG
jgi:hypothetical protein